MKLLVENLPSSTRINDLFSLLARYGHVFDVAIWRNRKTGRRWAIVEMEDDDQAERAIDELDGFHWRGKRLNVRETYLSTHRESA